MFNKALIIGILLVGATFSVSANEVQKWEYKCESVNNEMAQNWGDFCKKRGECDYALADEGIEWKFNQLGEEGWELSQTTYEIEYYGDAILPSNWAMVCFKRKKS